MTTTNPKVAVVLAGGRGERLRPYSVAIPKPLMPIGDMTVLEVIIRQLVREGFERIVIAVNHQASLIMALFGDGTRLDTRIEYSLESDFLGTFGPLSLIKDLPQNFVVLNGDVLTDIRFSNLLDSHLKSGSTITVAATVRKEMVDFGVLEVDNLNYIQGVQEKPTFEFLVSMGVYAVSSDAIRETDAQRSVGFDEAIRRTISEFPVPPFVFLHDGYWKDIGRPDDYLSATEEFELVRDELLG